MFHLFPLFPLFPPKNSRNGGKEAKSILAIRIHFPSRISFFRWNRWNKPAAVGKACSTFTHPQVEQVEHSQGVSRLFDDA